MTTIVTGAGGFLYMKGDGGDFTDFAGGSVVTYTPTEFVVQGAVAEYAFAGHGFSGDDGSGRPTAGTIDGLTLSSGGLPYGTFSDFTMKWLKFMSFVNANDFRGFTHALTDGNDTITGAELGDYIAGYKGNDTIYGAEGDDTLLAGPGSDTLYGGDDDDLLRMDEDFDASDAIDGGAGEDKLVLDGDYSAGTALAAATLTGVELIYVRDGNSYDLTTDDGNVAAGERLVVDAKSLGEPGVTAAGGHADGVAIPPHLVFDGSAELDGRFKISGGYNDDDVTGGAGADRFNLELGGDDTAHGGGGDDIFNIGVLAVDDTIDGGSGFDTAYVTDFVENLSDTLVFSATTITGIDRLVVTADISVDVQTNDATVAAGETLEVDMSAVATLSIGWNGLAETDGRFDLTGGGGSGYLTGGALGDTIAMSAHSSLYYARGAGGADDITCNTGEDRIVVTTVAESNSTAYDAIHGFDAGVDRFDLAVSVSSVSTASHDVSAATFDADMGSVISDQVCCVVTASGGDLIGHVFLFVDGLGGGGGYQAGQDYIFDITGYTGSLGTGNFI